jgi:hypothetical protein
MTRLVLNLHTAYSDVGGTGSHLLIWLIFFLLSQIKQKFCLLLAGSLLAFSATSVQTSAVSVSRLKTLDIYKKISLTLLPMAGLIGRYAAIGRVLGLGLTGGKCDTL